MEFDEQDRIKPVKTTFERVGRIRLQPADSGLHFHRAFALAAR
jgi:hypothetical protein